MAGRRYRPRFPWSRIPKSGLSLHSSKALPGRSGGRDIWSESMGWSPKQARSVGKLSIVSRCRQHETIAAGDSSCKGRGFCPSCGGRRMAAGAANPSRGRRAASASKLKPRPTPRALWRFYLLMLSVRALSSASAGAARSSPTKSRSSRACAARCFPQPQAPTRLCIRLSERVSCSRCRARTRESGFAPSPANFEARKAKSLDARRPIAGFRPASARGCLPASDGRCAG